VVSTLHQPFADKNVRATRLPMYHTSRSSMTLQQFRESLLHGQPPSGLSAALTGLWWDAKETGIAPTNPPSRMKVPPAPGFTPICIAKKATIRTQHIGTAAPGSLRAARRWNRNGRRLRRRCSREGDVALRLIDAYPALKRWATIGRPCGAGLSTAKAAPIPVVSSWFAARRLASHPFAKCALRLRSGQARMGHPLSWWCMREADFSSRRSSE
jgi:hypothetical protein